MRKTAYLFIFQLFICQNVIGQLIPEFILLSKEEKQNKEIAVGKIDITIPISKSLMDYFQIVDTIELIHNEVDLVNIKGCNFQYKLKIHRDSTTYKSGDRQILLLESLIPPYQTWEYNITTLNESELASKSQELRHKPYDNSVLNTAFQNCISYALEGIIRSYGINPEPFFFRRSQLADLNDIEVILKNLFIKVETLDNIKKKTINKSESLYKDQVFILFRNYKGEPIHACFNLNGRTWTKNGLKPYTSCPSPDIVIDSYNKTKNITSNYSESTIKSFKLSFVSSIEIYKLNKNIFKL